MEDKIKKFRALRQNEVTKMHELYNIAQMAIDSLASRRSFKVRYEIIENIRKEFDKNHNSILPMLAVVDGSDLEAETQIRESFDNEYFEIKVIYSDLLENPESSTANTDAQAPATGLSNLSHVNLPRIELPKFKGDLKAFPSFIDMYNSIVHNNKVLSDVEKFNYLISSLMGPPLSIVKCIPMTSNNYQIAYDNLIQRYSNKRLLASAHWVEIENAKKLHSENSQALRHLLDIFQENLSALENLGLPVKHWDFILVHMLLNRLDTTTITRFELHYSSNELPTFQLLMDFLESHCNALQTLTFSVPHNKIAKSVAPSTRPSSSSFFANTNNSVVCPLCKKNHVLYKCPEFHNKTPVDRYNFSKQNRLCVNCLSSSHNFKTCNSTSTCRKCQQRHHTLLHFEKTYNHIPAVPSDMPVQQIASTSNTEVPLVAASTHSFSGFAPQTSPVLLSTALVEISDKYGSFHKCRALIDSGSQTSFISQKCVNRLGLTHFNTSLSIQGLGPMHSFTSSSGVSLKIRPVGKSMPCLDLLAVVLPNICNNLPTASFSLDTCPHIKHLQLADPTFNIPGAIDILLGADVFPNIIETGRIVGNIDQPTALNTIFGYVLMGKLPTTALTAIKSFFSSLSTPPVEDILKKFWEVETVPEVSSLSPDDTLCEQKFVTTFSRNETGRFIVSLPFRNDEPIFPNSRNLALKYFLSLERRLLRDPSLYKQYSDFLQEYLDLGHMELLASPSNVEKCYYIPHHCILKPESSTTKLRVVFNASAKIPPSLSLNDTLLTGPKLQRDIVTILLNFRLHKVVFTADVKQMYRQILINTAHTDYQRILWRFTSDSPVQDFRLKTVTYGVSSAPYLAIRTLLQLAEEEKSDFPSAANILNSDTYIDDIVTGSSSLVDACHLKNELIELLKRGGFELRKWASNDPNLLSDLPASHLSSSPLSLDDECILKILGLHWYPSLDTFSYKVAPVERSCTKRHILSELARIFDPLGFLAPITFFTKYLIQLLWSLGVDWDQTPPDDVLSLWARYKAELPLLSRVSVPRHLFILESLSCEAHGFCDGSMKGYSAVVYFKVLDKNNDITTFLVCAKSKIAPLRRICIPRLELCGAVLLANMFSFVLRTYHGKIHFNKICAWTDSTITLSWIKSSPHRWKTFVSNRVSFIQDKIAPENWFHIPSGDNPADLASRGLFPSELLNNTLWWAGPKFLFVSEDPSSSHTSEVVLLPEALSEQRKITLHSVALLDIFDPLLKKYSSLSKVQRVVAYVLRFVFNIQNPAIRKNGAFSFLDLNQALLLLVKRTQHFAFSDLLNQLKVGKPPSKSFRKLSVFLDDQGILRVGGRLHHSALSYDKKHPALLPRSSRLTELIIEYFHKKYLHAGLQSVQFLIVQQFWIISAKRAIRGILSKCHTCWRLHPVPCQPVMGNLPSSRISQVKPFLHTGLDFGGPFQITLGKRRGAKTHKAYICLFVCYATKALHLELVSDLTSDAFLAALRRFIARRGRCNYLYSDCGTNFVGAYNKLSPLLKSAAEFEAIEWHFNPPSAPHFGGLWEAGIKSVKTHLYRVIGKQILTYEEFYTVLVQIEAFLNSRPLTPLSSDPNDLSVLTPGHFLTLEPLTTIPEIDLTAVPVGRLSRWQMLQRLHQDFWARWHSEYLHTLLQRSKWTSASDSIVPGSMVLIKNSLAPPLHWPLGRIVAVHPGADGVVRVATVRTTNGLLKRPVVKLCLLPYSKS